MTCGELIVFIQNFPADSKIEWLVGLKEEPGCVFEFYRMRDEFSGQSRPIIVIHPSESSKKVESQAY